MTNDRVGAVFRVEHISDISMANTPTKETAEEIREALMKIPGTVEVHVEELYEEIRSFKEHKERT